MTEVSTKEHEATIVAALAHYALHCYDPSEVYAALRSLHPEGDWDAWKIQCEIMRSDMRRLQDGAS